MRATYPLRGVYSKRILTLLLQTLLTLEFTGCASRTGPKSITHDRFDYAGAMTQSWKEQMLLNMIKLRYMDPPVFLDVQQVVQQYTLEGSGSIFAPGWTGNSAIAPAASASGRWAEKPYDHIPTVERRKIYQEPVAAGITGGFIFASGIGLAD